MELIHLLLILLRCITSVVGHLKFLRRSVRRAHELDPTLRFGEFMSTPPLLGIFPAGGQGGETECQYLSGGQYSALKSRQFSAVVISDL